MLLLCQGQLLVPFKACGKIVLLDPSRLRREGVSDTLGGLAAPAFKDARAGSSPKPDVWGRQVRAALEDNVETYSQYVADVKHRKRFHSRIYPHPPPHPRHHLNPLSLRLPRGPHISRRHPPPRHPPRHPLPRPSSLFILLNILFPLPTLSRGDMYACLVVGPMRESARVAETLGSAS